MVSSQYELRHRQHASHQQVTASMTVIPIGTPYSRSHIHTPDYQSRLEKLNKKPLLKNQFDMDFATYRRIRDLRLNFLKLLRMIGFSDYYFSRLPWVKQARQPLGTLPWKMLAIYEEEKFCEHDLALQHVRLTGLPVFMSSIEDFILEAWIKTDSFRRYGDLINVSKRFGYHDFYYIPLEVKDGCCCAMLSVTAKDMDRVDFRRRVEMHEEELHLLAEAVFCKGVSEFPEFF